MNAGYRLTDGGRFDVESLKEKRRILATFQQTKADGGKSDVFVEFTVSVSEARAIASALMGAAAEV